MINEARQLTESFFVPNVAHGRQYRFTPYTHKNIGRHYGLKWSVVARKDTPGSRKGHRQPMRDIRLMPEPKGGKYTPHQGKRECARRINQGLAS